MTEEKSDFTRIMRAAKEVFQEEEAVLKEQRAKELQRNINALLRRLGQDVPPSGDNG